MTLLPSSLDARLTLPPVRRPQHLEEGTSARLQLDFPARSLAGTLELGHTATRRNDAHASGRARLQFQWDVARQP